MVKVNHSKILEYIQAHSKVPGYVSSLEPAFLTGSQDKDLKKFKEDKILLFPYQNQIYIILVMPGKTIPLVADGRNKSSRPEIKSQLENKLCTPIATLKLYNPPKVEYINSAAVGLVLEIMNRYRQISPDWKIDGMLTLPSKKQKQLEDRLEDDGPTQSVEGWKPIEERIFHLECIYCAQRYKNTKAVKLHQRQCKFNKQ